MGADNNFFCTEIYECGSRIAFGHTYVYVNRWVIKCTITVIVG